MKVVLLLLVVGLAPSVALAQDKPSTDAAAASPNQFRVLLENEHVRVLEYSLKPGQRDQWHTHPAKVSYVAKGGKLRIHLSDGTSFETEDVEGTAVWMDPLPRHYAENIGAAPVQIILIEVKSAQRK
jgi:quercetin dioxygenase-like cupin family protein